MQKVQNKIQTSDRNKWLHLYVGQKAENKQILNQNNRKTKTDLTNYRIGCISGLTS